MFDMILDSLQMPKIRYKVDKLTETQDNKSQKAKKHSTSGRMHDRRHKQRYHSIIHTYVQLYVW